MIGKIFLTNPNREKKIITDNITYNNNNEIYNITNTNFRYINDITDENLITDLETLRKLLDPKRVKRLQDFMAQPGANSQTKWSANTRAGPSNTDDGLNPALLAVDGGYSAKSIRSRHRKFRRHKKTNHRRRKSNRRKSRRYKK